jgi:protein-S-isoprenylcysteine O-methyltransferase Ste14
MTPALLQDFLYVWIGLAAATCTLLFFISAPYGRHARGGWGPLIPNRVAWVVMEAASPLVVAACFALGKNHGPAAIAFVAIWEAHYFHRAFIYPLSLSKTARPMPVSVVAMGACFNLVNASTNGYYLFFVADYSTSWLVDPRFLCGTAIFVGGFVVNRWADAILRSLRKPGESGYKIPMGGPYRLVSSPNYLGEILEWTGWALLTWSLAGLAFAIWTFANLAPRARTNDRWYRAQFPDFPRERRVLLPFVW